MPVCLIEGPAGLSHKAKGELITNVLHVLVNAYQMVDDRVYINDYELPDVGHTHYEANAANWSIQSAAAKIVCTIIAPPGLKHESKRKMFKDITNEIARGYQIDDQRDVLVFLNEHPLDNVASNGYIQMENPAFESPATALQ